MQYPLWNFCLPCITIYLCHCFDYCGVFRDLNNGVKCKVQGGEDDEYDDVVTAFGESIVWRSWAKIASFGIWKINVYTVVSTVTQYNIQYTYLLLYYTKC